MIISVPSMFIAIEAYGLAGRLKCRTGMAGSGCWLLVGVPCFSFTWTTTLSRSLEAWVQIEAPKRAKAEAENLPSEFLPLALRKLILLCNTKNFSFPGCTPNYQFFKTSVLNWEL